MLRHLFFKAPLLFPPASRAADTARFDPGRVATRAQASASLGGLSCSRVKKLKDVVQAAGFMGVADLLLRKHTAIAKVLIPSSMAFGFMYTLHHGTNPLTDAKSAALGKAFLLDCR